MTPEERKKIVSAAVSKLSTNPENQKPDQVQLLFQKAQRSALSIQSKLKPILQAGGWVDQPAMFQMVARLYEEEFSNHNLYSKEELFILLILMHSSEMMKSIEASPYGNFSSPDALSGV